MSPFFVGASPRPPPKKKNQYTILRTLSKRSSQTFLTEALPFPSPFSQQFMFASAASLRVARDVAGDCRFPRVARRSGATLWCGGIPPSSQCVVGSGLLVGFKFGRVSVKIFRDTGEGPRRFSSWSFLFQRLRLLINRKSLFINKYDRRAFESFSQSSNRCFAVIPFGLTPTTNNSHPAGEIMHGRPPPPPPSPPPSSARCCHRTIVCSLLSGRGSGAWPRYKGSSRRRCHHCCRERTRVRRRL